MSLSEGITNLNYKLLRLSRIRRQKQKFDFFLFSQKDPFGESFSKIIFKSSSEFLFWKKIRKFEIGQNVPNLHNFYWAFSAFSQRSYKTTKNYLGFIFS